MSSFSEMTFFLSSIFILQEFMLISIVCNKLYQTYIREIYKRFFLPFTTITKFNV